MNIDFLVEKLLCDARKSLEYQIGCKGLITRIKDYYPYIPSYNTAITVMIKDILKEKNVEKVKFIDIGAGNNTIIDIMKIIGVKKSDGLEIEDLYLKLNPNLIKGDLLTYSFKNWDILYSYNPIKNNILMMKGLNNITSTMKKGAVFYFLSAGYSSEHLIKKGGEWVGNGLIKFKKI